MKGKGKGTRRSGGKQYVTVPEFSQRMGVTKQATYKAIRDGKLSVKIFAGEKTKYLDWEISRTIWESRIKPKRKTQREALIANEQGGYETLDGFIPETPDLKEVADVADINDIGEITIGKETFKLQNLDPNEFSDCWVPLKDGTPVINKNTGEHVYNWDMVDKKLKALLHNIQYRQRQEELISKEEVNYALSTIFKPLMTEIEQIPTKHITRIEDVIEDYTGKPLSDNCKNAIRAVMADTTKKIAEAFKESVKESLE